MKSRRNDSTKWPRHLPLLGGLALALLQWPTHSARAAEDTPHPATAAKMLQGVHRIVFLGDSITQAGDYVVDCECWLLAHGFKVEILNLGLASETVSDLTAKENEWHLKTFGFGRPFLSQRLDRALAVSKPDLLFACYGMNDGGSLPTNAAGTRRFGRAITKLRKAAIKAGAKRVVICTPPVFDDLGDAQQKFHDENLTRYTQWLLSKRGKGWDVVDIHTPMRRELDERKAKDPNFKFAGDGVHPGREGHWFIAREILAQFFGANPEGATSAADFFPAHGTEIRKLVRQRMEVLFNAWMTQIPHRRPEVPGGPGAAPGPSITEADEKAAALGNQIQLEMTPQ